MTVIVVIQQVPMISRGELERYRDEQDYLTRTEGCARDLARQRFVLESDVSRVVELARRHYRAWNAGFQAP